MLMDSEYLSITKMKSMKDFGKMTSPMERVNKPGKMEVLTKGNTNKVSKMDTELINYLMGISMKDNGKTDFLMVQEDSSMMMDLFTRVASNKE